VPKVYVSRDDAKTEPFEMSRRECLASGASRPQLPGSAPRRSFGHGRASSSG